MLGNVTLEYITPPSSRRKRALKRTKEQKIWKNHVQSIQSYYEYSSLLQFPLSGLRSAYRTPGYYWHGTISPPTSFHLTVPTKHIMPSSARDQQRL